MHWWWIQKFDDFTTANWVGAAWCDSNKVALDHVEFCPLGLFVDYDIELLFSFL